MDVSYYRDCVYEYMCIIYDCMIVSGTDCVSVTLTLPCSIAMGDLNSYSAS